MVKKTKVKLWFCDFWFPETEENFRNNMLFKQLRQHFDIVLDNKKPDFLFFSCFPTGKFSPGRVFDFHCQKIFVLSENLLPNFKFCDFSISFNPDIAGLNHYFPFYAWNIEHLLALTKPRARKIEKTSFCNFVYSHKVSFRENFFHLLCQYKKVDSAGGRLNNTLSGKKIKDKLVFMQPYKFSIAFENTSSAGYTTEKIIDSFMANTVPIYYGNPNIGEHFNPKAFINCHDFKNFESVVEYVKKVDQDEELLNSYLQASPFVGNKLSKAAQFQRLCDALENIFQKPYKKPVCGSIYFQLIRLRAKLFNSNIYSRQKKKYESKIAKFFTNKF